MMATASSPSSAAQNHGSTADHQILYPLIFELALPDQRENALLELSKKREEFPELAPILWHSFGTISALLQEIVSIYPLLSPAQSISSPASTTTTPTSSTSSNSAVDSSSNSATTNSATNNNTNGGSSSSPPSATTPSLTAHASNRVCNALALLQCVASHPETRSAFLNAHVPLYLYPFLNTTSKNRPFEYLRLTSLGVIGALVKMDDSDVINFLLQTEIIPLCLRIMETGSELSKTVATFIVQKILLDEMGLNYICATAERFYAVSTVLGNMVGILVDQPSTRLLKHIVRCYLRLSDNLRAREALRQCVPEALRDGKTFVAALKDDVTTSRWLSSLVYNINDTSGASTSGGNGATLSGNKPPPASSASSNPLNRMM